MSNPDKDTTPNFIEGCVCGECLRKYRDGTRCDFPITVFPTTTIHCTGQVQKVRVLLGISETKVKTSDDSVSIPEACSNCLAECEGCPFDEDAPGPIPPTRDNICAWYRPKGRPFDTANAPAPRLLSETCENRSPLYAVGAILGVIAIGCFVVVWVLLAI